MKEEVFQELLKSVREGGKIMNGLSNPSRVFRYSEPKVSTLRKRYGLTQPKFAAMMGISVNTLRNWEQGRRVPKGPARILLNVVLKHPEAILDTVHTAHPKRAA